jgi:hypothetical protein
MPPFSFLKQNLRDVTPATESPPHYRSALGVRHTGIAVLTVKLFNGRPTTEEFASALFIQSLTKG